MICPNLSQGPSPYPREVHNHFCFFFAISLKHKHPFKHKPSTLSINIGKKKVRKDNTEGQGEQQAIKCDMSDHKLGDSRFGIVVLHPMHRWHRAPSTDQGHPSCRRPDLRNHLQGHSYSPAEWQVKIHAAWGQIAKPSALWLKITSQQSNFICCKLFLSFPLQDLLHLILEQVVLPATR